MSNWVTLTTDQFAAMEREIEEKEAEIERLNNRLAYFEAITTGAEHKAIDAAQHGGQDMSDFPERLRLRDTKLFDDLSNWVTLPAEQYAAMQREIERLRGLLLDVLATKQISPLPLWLRVEIKAVLNNTKEKV